MTTSYKNPNKALWKKPVPHPVQTAIRRGIAVFLSLLLIVSLFLTLAVAAVRTTVTPAFVYRFAEGINYPDLPLPTGDGFMTVTELLEEGFRFLQLPFTREDVLELFDAFSIPTIVAAFAQDCFSWLLHDGPRPTLDAYTIAETVLAGLDPEIIGILQIFGNPTAMLALMLEERLAGVDLDGLLDRLEPVRQVLSADTFAWLVSISGILAVFLYFVSLCRMHSFALPFGISLFSIGVLSLVTAWFLPLCIPRLTVVYASLLTEFISPITGCLCRYAVLLLITGALLASYGILYRVVSVQKRRIPDRTVTTSTPPSQG